MTEVVTVEDLTLAAQSILEKGDGWAATAQALAQAAVEDIGGTRSVTYFVNQETGSDENTGTAAVNAFATLQKCISSATANTSITIKLESDYIIDSRVLISKDYNSIKILLQDFNLTFSSIDLDELNGVSGFVVNTRSSEALIYFEGGAITLPEDRPEMTKDIWSKAIVSSSWLNLAPASLSVKFNSIDFDLADNNYACLANTQGVLMLSVINCTSNMSLDGFYVADVAAGTDVNTLNNVITDLYLTTL